MIIRKSVYGRFGLARPGNIYQLNAVTLKWEIISVAPTSENVYLPTDSAGRINTGAIPPPSVAPTASDAPGIGAVIAGDAVTALIPVGLYYTGYKTAATVLGVLWLLGVSVQIAARSAT